MLDRVFMQILDMSKTGSIVILVVLLARLLLKKSPKMISYALWAVVLLRLLCPVSIESPASILPQTNSVSESYTLEDIPISVAGAGVAAYQAVGDVLNGGIDVQHIPTTNIDEAGNVEYVTANWSEVWILFGQYIWVAGVAGMILYSIVSYWKLKKRLSVKMLLRDNIYVADDIDSPFVIGLIKPEIYLPATLAEKEQSYIIAHEQHHIHRCDHIIKVLAFAALVLHWMNPLAWVAFVLASRDMEMSCDEAVVRKLGEEIRGDYAASLLSLATGKRIIAGAPLAFGEGDPKDRIKNLSKWKKPVIWVSVVTVVLCGVLAVCLLTDREGKDSNAGMTFYYGTLVETDGEGFVIEQADGNVLQFNNNEDFTLNANFHIGHYVLVRCNTSERQTVADVDIIEPIGSSSLEEAVDATIKLVHYSPGNRLNYTCTNFVLLDQETEEDEYVILYGLALHQVYRGHLGIVSASSECHDVVAIKFIITDAGEYVLAEYWQPRNGANYSADIAAKFPGGEVPYTQEYIDAQRDACKEQAQLYFDTLEQQAAEEKDKQEEIKQEAESATKPTEGTELTVSGPGSDIDFRMITLETKYPFIFDSNDEWTREYLSQFDYVHINELKQGALYVLDFKTNEIRLLFESGALFLRETPDTAFFVKDGEELIRTDYYGEKVEIIYKAQYGKIVCAERFEDIMCLVVADRVICINLITYEIENVYVCEDAAAAFLHTKELLIWRTPDWQWRLIDRATGIQREISEVELDILLATEMP